ncbi:LysR family transcriptional regulator [Streptomyces sp. Act143]|uniref:LysR family substrate-binding domain-containing protein n=1 Tax=Streptomyces sp. Act143 TaxID=2200760 RepID=UPI000D680512|nr:LysR family substrate-binding domain-containing protein [Streptomyces sp. Act143]PWI20148.1 LysR family transcriptional regulator [Streptomyces sp. Act143]
MTGPDEPTAFRLAYVPGATPAKWVRIWHERFPDLPLTLLQLPGAEATAALRGGSADAGLVRLPVDRMFFSAIPLYTETTVVVVPKDHVIAAVEEVTLEDLADETVLHPLDDVFDWERPPGEPAFERPATTEDAIELVAAGIGVLVVPQSLARLYHRRDLTYRPVTDAPESSVALSWPEEATTDLVEDFIGIVRGRTVNSTRGRTASQDEAKAKTKAKAEPKKQQPRRSDAAGGRRKPPAAKKAQAARRGKPRRRS